jgi:hypothetical protein
MSVWPRSASPAVQVSFPRYYAESCPRRDRHRLSLSRPCAPNCVELVPVILSIYCFDILYAILEAIAVVAEGSVMVYLQSSHGIS